jgi:hypothetical protein
VVLQAAITVSATATVPSFGSVTFAAGSRRSRASEATTAHPGSVAGE